MDELSAGGSHFPEMAQYSQLDDAAAGEQQEGDPVPLHAPFTSQFMDEFFGFTPNYSTLEESSSERTAQGAPPVSLYSNAGFSASTLSSPPKAPSLTETASLGTESVSAEPTVELSFHETESFEDVPLIVSDEVLVPVLELVYERVYVRTWSCVPTCVCG